MGDTTNRLAGTAYVTCDGITVMVAGQFKYSPSITKRETLTGMDGVHGYRETPNAPYIAGQLRDSGLQQSDQCHRRRRVGQRQNHHRVGHVVGEYPGSEFH